MAVAAVCGGLAGWMLIDRASSNAVATVGSLFVGIVTLFLALVDFFRHEPPPLNPSALADDLALVLKDQWLEEATARGLRDPRVLPLAWTATDRDVARLPRTANARVLRMRLNGRLDGDFDEAIGRLAAGYDQLPNRRLVAIGEPGSGKSVLAILLTLGLLGAREPGGPVPVLLPASSWDPVREPLDDWIVRALALPHYGGREEIPRVLLGHGLLLPVLDGLDEIPESARRSAIRSINLAIGAERPVVVTCRATEYEDLIRGGAPTLREAPVVEICPVSPGDAVAYLRDVDWPAGTDWTPVYAHLRAARHGPVAAALSTPLMVTSARLVYQRLADLDPTELLDSTRFDCQYSVEQHITDKLIDAAYAPDPRLPDAERSGGRWSAGQAREWLTFLARYLHDHRERDLAWWRMSERLLSPWFPPALGVAAGLLLGIGCVAWIVGTDVTKEYAVLPVIAGSIGGGFALLSTIVWYAAPHPLPGRLSFSVQGSWGRLRHGFRIGARLTALAVAPLLVGVTSVAALDEWKYTYTADELYYEMFAVGLSLMLVIGLALAAHNWLNAPPHHATQVSPTNSLAQDRGSAVAGAAVAGCMVAATGLMGWYAGLLSGAWLHREVNDWTGWPEARNVALLAAGKWDAMFDSLSGEAPVWIGLTIVLPGTVFALLLLLTRAWPRFLVVRLFLAARRRLPLRLMGFLADARRRGLLRQSGGAYQFRHVRLQETLAGRPLYGDGPRTGTGDRTVRRRVVLVAGAMTVTTVAFSNRKRDQSLKVWSSSPFPSTLAFHPGSRARLFIGSYYGSVWRWDHEERPPLREHLIREAPKAEPTVSCLVHHPSRPLLVLSDGDSTEVRSTGDGALLKRLLEKTMTASDLAFSPSGHLLVASDGEVMRLWTPGADGSFTGTPVSRKAAHGAGGYSSLLFDPDASQPIALDDTGRVWRYSADSLEPEKGPLASAHEKKTRDTFSGLAAGWRNGLLAFIRIDYDSDLCHVGLWTRTGPLSPWSETPWTRKAYSVAVHPVAPFLVTSDQHGPDVHVWHYTGGSPVYIRTLKGHTDRVFSLTFSPQGDLLATISDDETVRLWETGDWLRR
ncbi:hypothetical protein KEF29_38320 [Streptomyces tuirus]|uniref:NACHT domain-containing protein n=1 Tax=Streptomyces tuirus TaxID=68278 RepID=A0A941FEL4_9ACTN|nr:hypothetical protein [Streptomyces tuirus]